MAVHFWVSAAVDNSAPSPRLDVNLAAKTMYLCCPVCGLPPAVLSIGVGNRSS